MPWVCKTEPRHFWLHHHIRELCSICGSELVWQDEIEVAGKKVKSRRPPKKEKEPDKIMERVGFFRYNGLGDVLMCSVAARAYKTQGAYTTFITQAPYAPLLSRCPGVDEVRIANGAPDPGEFDHFFHLDRGGEQQFDFLAEGLTTDRIDLILQLCEVETTERTPRLELNPGDYRAAETLWQSFGWETDRCVIALAPFSEAIPRRLTHEGALRLATAVLRQFPGSRLLWLLDEERELLLPPALVQVSRILRQVPLSLVAAALRQVDGLISVDTGTMHLGGALGVPTLGLFSEVAAETRITHYPTLWGHSNPESCPWDFYPCNGKGGQCIGTYCLSQYPERIMAKLPELEIGERYLQRQQPGELVLPTLRVDTHANPTLRTEAGRREFYRQRGGTDYEISHPEANRADTNHYEYPRVQWVLDRLQGDSILDVGTAGGQLTCLYAKLTPGRVVDACEPHPAWSAHLREQLNGQVWEMFIEDLLVRPEAVGRYQTVVLSEILEHLGDPGRVLLDLTLRLKPERILCTTPNGVWNGTDEHLWVFDEISLRELIWPLEGTVEVIPDRSGQDRWLGVQIDRPQRRRRGD